MGSGGDRGNQYTGGKSITGDTFGKSKEETLLDAEVKIGELTKGMPLGSGGDRRSKDFKSNTSDTFEKSKDEVLKELGLKKMQVSRFESLADNPDLVDAVKREAVENEDIP